MTQQGKIITAVDLTRLVSEFVRIDTVHARFIPGSVAEEKVVVTEVRAGYLQGVKDTYEGDKLKTSSFYFEHGPVATVDWYIGGSGTFRQ